MKKKKRDPDKILFWIMIMLALISLLIVGHFVNNYINKPVYTIEKEVCHNETDYSYEGIIGFENATMECNWTTEYEDFGHGLDWKFCAGHSGEAREFEMCKESGNDTCIYDASMEGEGIFIPVRMTIRKEHFIYNYTTSIYKSEEICTKEPVEEIMGEEIARWDNSDENEPFYEKTCYTMSGVITTCPIDYHSLCCYLRFKKSEITEEWLEENTGSCALIEYEFEYELCTTYDIFCRNYELWECQFGEDKYFITKQ